MNSQSRPYFDSNGRPIMEQSVIVLADILGFKEMMKKAHEKGNEQEQLKWLIERLDKALPEINDRSRAKWSRKSFSDNVIVAYPHKDLGSGAFEFLQACHGIGHFQLELAVDGLFIRGGIAVGSIHISDDLIFGYILEELSKAEKLANNPRIILLESAMHHVHTHPGIEEDKLLTVILRDDADAKFINYLFPLQAHSISERARMLRNHKHEIESNLKKYRFYPNDYPIYKKYVWAANYHNTFCRESHLCSSDDTYMISM